MGGTHFVPCAKLVRTHSTRAFCVSSLLVACEPSWKSISRRHSFFRLFAPQFVSGLKLHGYSDPFAWLAFSPGERAIARTAVASSSPSKLMIWGILWWTLSWSFDVRFRQQFLMSYFDRIFEFHLDRSFEFHFDSKLTPPYFSINSSALFRNIQPKFAQSHWMGTIGKKGILIRNLLTIPIRRISLYPWISMKVRETSAKFSTRLSITHTNREEYTIQQHFCNTLDNAKINDERLRIRLQ